MKNNHCRFWSFLIFLLFLPLLSLCQNLDSAIQFSFIKGTLRDIQSEEPISFASVYWKFSSRGVKTDSVGNFSVSTNFVALNDTLIISSVGFITKMIPKDKITQANLGDIFLNIQPPIKEVVVSSKYNRGVWFWKKIMAKKNQNNPNKLLNFYAKLYNKIEIDLINFNIEKFNKNVITKPLGFVFNYVDSISERKPFLPIFLTEVLSDYYYQSKPNEKSYEYINHIFIKGIENKTILKELGGSFQQLNPYDNYFYVLRVQFVSPFHENGPDFYHYKMADTMIMNGMRLIRFRFNSKSNGSLTFDGEAWIDDATKGIQKITLRPNSFANVNFIEKFSVIQEFVKISDTTWVKQKDKFIADITPIGEKNVALKARKTAIYNVEKTNDTSVSNFLQKIKGVQVVVVSDSALSKENQDSIFYAKRPVELEHSEKLAMKVLDTLYKNKTYLLYTDIIQVVALGTYDIKKITIGPWYNWVSGNQYEGLKLRFDLATSFDFSKKWNLSGFLAYGFADQEVKGGFKVHYQIKRQPWQYFNFGYNYDVTARSSKAGFGVNNIFGSLLRLDYIPIKLQFAEDASFSYYKQNNYGFSFKIDLGYFNFKPLLNLPSSQYYTSIQGDPFTSFQSTITLRYAFKERYLVFNFDRTTLKSRSPIFTFSLTKSWKTEFSTNDFEKYSLSIDHFVNFPKFGRLTYQVAGNYISGTVAYPYLDFLTGNEALYYNRAAFNLLNQFEIATNKNILFNLEHTIYNSFFALFKATKRWKIRQFWNVRGAYCGITGENRLINIINTPYFNAVNEGVYMELGTGIENIFRYFRIDFVWRVLTPETVKPLNGRNFGIFASFRFQF